MRKIREFNMDLPFKEIRRRALRGAQAPPPGFDDARLAAVLDAAERTLKPSVIFESYGPEAPDTAALAPLPGLAHTVAITTLGPGFGAHLDETRTASPAAGKVLDAAAAVASERATQFVLSLLKDEVEAERCDLSPIQYLDDPQAVALVHERLGGAKIGVGVEAGRLAPAHTRAFCVSWIARRGRRGAKAAPKR